MKTTALVALFVMMLAVSVYADGMIIPEPIPPCAVRSCPIGGPCPDWCPPPPYPRPAMMEVKYHHVNVSIDNQFTETNIDQVFHNPNSWQIEGTYLFPLPEGASIQKFSMYVDGQELKGEVLDADTARRTYEDLVRKMIDPGLLEYVDRNTFKASVYPIDAYADKRVKLDYSEVISCEGGVCEYTYPLNTEKFSGKNLDDVTINVRLKSNIAIKSIYSPSHKIEVRRLSDYEAIVSYEARDVKPDTDFKLIYTVSEDDIGLNLIAHKTGGTGYFLMMLAPKFSDSGQKINKDIIFVLDKSGSMAGEKIEQAKEALKFCVNSLNEGDRFGMVLYESEAYLAKPLNLVGRTDMDRIKAHILNLSEKGGTYMEAGLKLGTSLFENVTDYNPDEYENRIIFLTDAQPNIGDTSESGLMGMTRKNADDKIYLTFIGMGVDFNTELIEAITKIRGANYYSVHSSSEFKKRMDEEFEYMVTPLVFNLVLKLEATGYDIEKVYGSPEANESTGEIMRVNTLFPSKTEEGQTKGGIILLKLKKTSPSASLRLKVSYEDRNGRADGGEKSIAFGQQAPDYYQNSGIRKAALLARYADLMKNWVMDEREALGAKKPVTPHITTDSGIMPPRDWVILGQWERQSVPLTVSSKYKELFEVFAEHFSAEMNSIGDDTLSQEYELLAKLSDFSG